MDISAIFRESARRHLTDPYEITPADRIPARDDVPLGPAATRVDATALSVDIRRYSEITNTFGREIVVKLLKAFFDGSVRLVVGAGGVVAEFNGDGLIALFTGIERTANAFRAAAGVRWFLVEILRPCLAAYLRTDRVPSGRVEEFDAGCSLDDGTVLVSRVGIGACSDIAWVGRCVNTAAKLCKLARSPQALIVTREVHERLRGSVYANGVEWLPIEPIRVGGMLRTVFSTGYACAPSSLA